ncbi:hypothetical protein F0562_010916 [Nyssa sinensis]|uniref:Uncharacterized protein n=1 Tax=Nyssa sinensis TaxID=561372 RepID=A0A5J5A0E7_9ASTE|nr:hypothetical protein F0562_010916 [Nyssa sinensis]
MISSAAAVNGLRVLRSQPKSNTYGETLTDKMVEIDDTTSLSKNRQRRMSYLAKEVGMEALIAISVGFLVDSLTEEEIKANVVSGGSSISPELHPLVMEQVRTRATTRAMPVEVVGLEAELEGVAVIGFVGVAVEEGINSRNRPRRGEVRGCGGGWVSLSVSGILVGAVVVVSMLLDGSERKLKQAKPFFGDGVLMVTVAATNGGGSGP